MIHFKCSKCEWLAPTKNKAELKMFGWVVTRKGWLLCPNCHADIHELASSRPDAKAKPYSSVSLDELEPFGNPRIRTLTLARSEDGGSVVVQVAAVHTHGCPYWREGKRHGPCTCGALEAWETFYPGVTPAGGSR